MAFNVRNRKVLILNPKILLLPSFSNGGTSLFGGWYTDSGYENLFTDSVISADTKVYGKFKNGARYFTITFDTKGGKPTNSVTVQYGACVPLLIP